MKKKIAYLLSAALCMGSLSGCAQTPENSLVKQKGTASLGNYEEGSTLEDKVQDSANAAGDSDKTAEDTQKEDSPEETENLLRTVLGAPQTYESTLTDATGKLTINTNAAVEIPNADKVSAINVSQHPFDQEQADLITNVFFADGKIYDLDELTRMTKADCMEKIQELKGYVAEGNLDPYGQGKDEDGNYYYDIYGAIEAWEQNYEDAPEEVEMVEVTPSLDRQVQADDGSWYTDDFYGYVVMPDESEYTYTLKQYNSMPMDVEIGKVHIDTETGEKLKQFTRPWREFSMLENTEHTGWRNFPTRDELEEKLGITLEEAKATAEEKIAALGFSDMQLQDWDYGIYGAEHSELQDDVIDVTVQDYGYILHYTRMINNIPITYTQSYGGALESMESDMETWGYEILDIVVTRDGIDAVDLFNRYDVGEIKTENLNLLSFDEIMQIYEKMILIDNASVTDYAEAQQINVSRITFGYTRIYEPAASSQTGILVPAWDFFGGRTTQYKDEDGNVQTYENYDDTISLITINAIDGSIIDRELGY